MAKPHIVLFHEALYRIVRARGLVGDRAEKGHSDPICAFSNGLQCSQGIEPWKRS